MAEAVPNQLDMVALKALWDTLDKNADGLLQGKEWGRHVKEQEEQMKLFFGGETLKEIGMQFNRIDEDGNDLLSWDEFVGAAQMSDLKKLFLTLDADANGKVSSKEWGQAVGQKWETMAAVFGGKSRREVGMYFNTVDKNEDETLTWEEFSKAYYAQSCTTEYTELRTLWDSLNKDENDCVDSKEWGTAINQNQEIAMKYFGGSTLQEIASQFRKIDANNDKKLSWVEVVEAADIGSFKKLFMSIDSDGSGMVDSKEWGRQLTSFYEEMGQYFTGLTLGQMGAMFKDIDTNHDDKISWPEMEKALIAHQAKMEEGGYELP